MPLLKYYDILYYKLTKGPSNNTAVPHILRVLVLGSPADTQNPQMLKFLIYNGIGFAYNLCASSCIV